MDNCIFCKIVEGSIPSTKIYEDDNFLAFLDIMPINEGHALVIPKKHYENFVDVPEKLMDDMMKVVRKVYQALSSSLAPSGFNIFNNNGKAAGQEVPHVHIHIVPRFDGDGPKIKWQHGKYKEGKMEEVAKKVSKFL